MDAAGIINFVAHFSQIKAMARHIHAAHQLKAKSLNTKSVFFEMKT